jgi:hypothetical protein
MQRDGGRRLTGEEFDLTHQGSPAEARSTMLPRKKREDTAEGCRLLAEDDRARAAATPNEHMRSCLEGSADAWAARAKLLDRLEANFNARAEANVRDRTEQSGSEREDNG